MEPPPAAAAPPASATVATAAAVGSAPHLNYPDSVDSSPRSRNADSWDEPQFPAVPGGGAVGGKLRLMCSYNGHIVPRPHDKFLCYVGGDTRIVVADRHSTLSELTSRLSKTLLNGRSFTLKYQLPNEDLDSLISVTTDEDLENMIEEYDRLANAAAAAAAATNTATQKSSRLRLFLFPSKPDSGSSIGSLLENSTKSEDWFLNALNGAASGLGESASVNCLLGLDDDVATAGNGNSSGKDGDPQIESFGNVKGLRSNSNKQSAQDVHSVPDSPILETSSSFGSTSSSPSLANLPPIRVHVEDQKPTLSGIEEQFSQMSIAAAVQKQDDGGFMVMSTPPTVFPAITPSAATVAAPAPGLVPTVFPGDYSNRVISDDERSDQGMPVGYRKPPQPQLMPPQSQPKPTGGVDLASPDSVSSDNSATNPLSRQRPMVYQDPIIQNPSGNSRVAMNPLDPKLSDPSSKVQIQQVHDSSYALPTQFDQQHQQFNPQQQQQQQHQQQHFIQAGTHYIHHPPPSGAVPMPSFYPMYAHQQQQQPVHPLDQQQYVYYVSARQAQAYSLPVQQPNYNEAVATAPSTRPQTPPTSSMMPPPAATYSTARNVPASKQPEMASGMYRPATAAASHLVQVPSNQHQHQHQQQQFVGFSQIHHPPQSVNPTGNYAYEFADPAQAQVYYTQPLAPQLAAQYQTMTSAPAAMLPEASSQLPMDNIRQQVRTSQP